MVVSEIPVNQSTTLEPSHIPLHRLELSAPFALQRISDMRMSRPLHDHARLFLTGMVDEEQQGRVLEQARADQPLILTLRGEEGQPARTLFHGELQQVRMSMVRGVYTVELEAVSHTYQLDVRPRTRSFQDSQMTYAELIRQVLELYPDADCIQMVGDEVKLGELLVQYQETDWAFLQRMASRFGTVLVPEVTLPGPKLWFGVPEGRSVSLDNAHYRLRRSFDKDATAEFNHILESGTQAQPGDEVEWAGTSWTIGEITTSIQRELLLYEYRLMPEGSIHKPLRHNARLTGAILEGKVLEVREDHLRVHLEVDEQQDPAKSWWFPYGTLYSAEGHSGWYVMPEVGDQIQVYFPNVRETEAVATASIRRAKSASAKLADPQVKVWGTAAGKSIELSPSELTLTASSGKVDIRLHSGGVQVSSDSSLSVSAKSRLSLHADERVQVDAGSAIYLHAGGSSLVLDGETDLRSAQVKLEGTVKRPVFVADLEPVWEPPIAGAPTPGDSSSASDGEGGDSSSGGSSSNAKGSKGGQAATTPTANLMGAQLNALKMGQAVAGMIPALGASPVTAAVGAIVAVTIAGAMPFMGYLSPRGARGRSSSGMFGQHLFSVLGGPLLGKAYTAARLFGRTPMAEELIKAMKDEMKRKQRYSTYMALHMEKDLLRPKIEKETLAAIKARNPDSKLYGGEKEGFYQAQQYYLVWLYGSKATERLSQEELGHNSYLIYQLHSMQKKGQDLSTLTVEEMDRLSFENASRWFKIDSAVVTAYGAGTAYMEGRALSSTGKVTVNPEGMGKGPNKYLEKPADENGTLNIGARGKPIEGAYNIDIDPKSPDVYYGDATHLANIKTGSQNRIIFENPFGYDPLNPEVLRVLSRDGEIIITGSRSNMKKLIKQLDDKGLKIKGERRDIPNDGSYLTTDGEKIMSPMLDQYKFIRDEVR